MNSSNIVVCPKPYISLQNGDLLFNKMTKLLYEVKTYHLDSNKAVNILTGVEVKIVREMTPVHIFIVDFTPFILNRGDLAYLNFNDQGMNRTGEDGMRYGSVVSVNEHGIETNNQFGNISRAKHTEYPNVVWGKIKASTDLNHNTLYLNHNSVKTILNKILLYNTPEDSKEFVIEVTQEGVEMGVYSNTTDPYIVDCDVANILIKGEDNVRSDDSDNLNDKHYTQIPYVNLNNLQGMSESQGNVQNNSNTSTEKNKSLEEEITVNRKDETITVSEKLFKKAMKRAVRKEVKKITKKPEAMYTRGELEHFLQAILIDKGNVQIPYKELMEWLKSDPLY